MNTFALVQHDFFFTVHMLYYLIPSGQGKFINLFCEMHDKSAFDFTKSALLLEPLEVCFLFNKIESAFLVGTAGKRKIHCPSLV